MKANQTLLVATRLATARVHFFLLLAIGIALPLSLQAHQDRYYTFEVENVVVRIRTGFEYEEVYKAEMLARMVRDLARELDYSDRVQIDFIHDYTFKSNQNDVFVNIGRPRIIQNYEDEYLSSSPNDAHVIIRNVYTKIDCAYLLRVAEMSIQNRRKIKRRQKQIHYQGGYNNWTLYSVDPELIREWLECMSFTAYGTIASKRYYRGIPIDERDYTYYFQDWAYHFVPSGPDTEKVLLTLPDVFQAHALDDQLIVVETPRKIHVCRADQSKVIPDYPYSDGVWRLLDFVSCSDDSLLVRFRSSTSPDPAHYFDGAELLYDFPSGTISEIGDYDCMRLLRKN